MLLENILVYSTVGTRPIIGQQQDPCGAGAAVERRLWREQT